MAAASLQERELEEEILRLLQLLEALYRPKANISKVIYASRPMNYYAAARALIELAPILMPIVEYVEQKPYSFIDVKFREPSTGTSARAILMSDVRGGKIFPVVDLEYPITEHDLKKLAKYLHKRFYEEAKDSSQRAITLYLLKPHLSKKNVESAFLAYRHPALGPTLIPLPHESYDLLLDILRERLQPILTPILELMKRYFYYWKQAYRRLEGEATV